MVAWRMYYTISAYHNIAVFSKYAYRMAFSQIEKFIGSSKCRKLQENLAYLRSLKEFSNGVGVYQEISSHRRKYIYVLDLEL